MLDNSGLLIMQTNFIQIKLDGLAGNVLDIWQMSTHLLPNQFGYGGGCSGSMVLWVRRGCTVWARSRCARGNSMFGLCYEFFLLWVKVARRNVSCK